MDELNNLFAAASVVGNSEEDATEWFVVDHDFRTIHIPPNKKLLGVTSDERVNTLHFKLPRYYGTLDLTPFEFRINYLNANGEGDIYIVTGADYDNEYIVFDWSVGRHACMYNGEVSFIICARTYRENTDPPVIDREYNTAIHRLTVELGIEVDEPVYTANYDLIEQILREIGESGAAFVNYETLERKPRINNVQLYGNKTSTDLGLADLSYIANTENSMTATRDYVVNDLFVVGGTLYKVNSAVTSGNTFIVGTNCETTTLGQLISYAISRPAAAVLG